MPRGCNAQEMTRIYLRPGADVPALIAELGRQESALGDVENLSGIEKLRGYRRWSTDAMRTLSHYLVPDSLSQLITTPGYWFLHGLEAEPAPANMDSTIRLFRSNTLDNNWVLRLEVEQRRAALTSAREDIQKDSTLWRDSRETIIVADTNVFLHHHEMYRNIQWEKVKPQADHVDCWLIIPLLVIDEIDKRKRAAGELVDSKESRIPEKERKYGFVRSRAKAVLRQIDQDVAEVGTRCALRGGVPERPSRLYATIIMDDPGHKRLPLPDDELISRACDIQNLAGKEVHFVSYDTGARIRARAAGLIAAEPPLAIDELDENRA